MQKLFDEVVQYLSGSCISVSEAFSDICKFSSQPMVPKEALDEFEVYLEKIDLYCCGECGWWGYPGDTSCDCEEVCEECREPMSECLCKEICEECGELENECSCET